MSQQREASTKIIANVAANLSPVSLQRLLNYALAHLSDEALARVAGMATGIAEQSQGKRQSRNARMAKPVVESWRIGQ